MERKQESLEAGGGWEEGRKQGMACKNKSKFWGRECGRSDKREVGSKSFPYSFAKWPREKGGFAGVGK